MPQLKATSGIADTFIRGYCSRGRCSSRGGRSAVSGNAHRHPHQPLRGRRRCGGVDLRGRGGAAATSGGRPGGGRGRAHGGGLARRTAPGDAGRRLRRGGRRFRRRTFTPTGTSARRRSAKASSPPTRSRATPATFAPHGRRATSCSALPSRPRVGCAGRTGPIRTDAGPTRTSRASTTARPGSATTSGRCTRSRTSRVSAPARSPACAGWSRRRKAVRALRLRARGAGRTIPTRAPRTTGSAWARRASCSSSTRSPTGRATRPSARTHARAPRGCAS